MGEVELDVAHALAADRRFGIHALDLRIAIEKRDTGAGDCLASGAGEEKPHSRLEQAIDGQSVLLSFGVACERRVQFLEQANYLLAWRFRQFDCYIHA